MDFGKPHTNFGVLLSMHAWVMTISNLGCRSVCFCVTLMLVHESSKKMVPTKTSTYYLKAHRSNNMVLKFPAQGNGNSYID